MTDTIEIQDLKIETVVGINDWERRVRQSLRLDVELDCDLGPAGASDRVRDTVDYKTLSNRIRDRLQATSYRLIETLAADAVEICLEDARVTAARVRVKKPGALRHATSVGVRVSRTREQPSARAPHVAFVGIGSNIEPVHHVREALEALHTEFGALRVSPVYRTEPVGLEGSPEFLNLAASFRSKLSARDLQAWLHAQEDRQGRVRTDDPNAPRTIDLDLLLYDDLVCEEDGLVLPHPQTESAAFVLVPLADLAPNRVHPGQGVTLADLRSKLPQDVPGVSLFEDEVLF